MFVNLQFFNKIQVAFITNRNIELTNHIPIYNCQNSAVIELMIKDTALLEKIAKALTDYDIHDALNQRYFAYGFYQQDNFNIDETNPFIIFNLSGADSFTMHQHTYHLKPMSIVLSMYNQERQLVASDLEKYNQKFQMVSSQNNLLIWNSANHVVKFTIKLRHHNVNRQKTFTLAPLAHNGLHNLATTCRIPKDDFTIVASQPIDLYIGRAFKAGFHYQIHTNQRYRTKFKVHDDIKLVTEQVALPI